MSAIRAASARTRSPLPPTSKLGRRCGISRWSLTVVVRTVEGDRVPVEEAAEDPDRLLQSSDPLGWPIEGHAERRVLGLGVTGPDSELKSTFGQQIQCSRVSRHEHWVAQIVVQHERPDPKPRRRCGHRVERDQRRNQPVEHMIRDQDGVEPVVLGASSLVLPLRPRLGCEHLQPESEGARAHKPTLPAEAHPPDPTGPATRAPSGVLGHVSGVAPIECSGMLDSRQAQDSTRATACSSTQAISSSASSKKPRRASSTSHSEPRAANCNCCSRKWRARSIPAWTMLRSRSMP